jgi:hypothetical protein
MAGHVAEAVLFTTFLEDGMPGIEITEVEGSSAKQ